MTPTYNRPDELVRCGKSITAQSYTNWFWVVVNDGSTIDYSEANCTLASPNILHLNLSQNSGVTHARNVGLDTIQGMDADFVVFLDDDDELEKNCLSETAKIIRGNPAHCWFVSNRVHRRTGEAFGIAIKDSVSTDYISDFLVERKIRGDKSHVISTDAIGEKRFHIAGRGEWTLLIQIAQQHAVFLWPYPSQLGDYLPEGISSTQSHVAGQRDAYGCKVWSRAIAPIYKAIAIVKSRPTCWRAQAQFLTQAAKTSMRLIVLLASQAISVLSRRTEVARLRMPNTER